MARGFVLLVALGIAACRRPPPPEQAPVATAATPVRLAAVERGPIARPIRGTGVVRLKREMDLSFKVGGVVAAVLVEEGAHVKKGQVLARLDPTEVEAALRQATESRAKAERDFARSENLHASGAIGRAELQNAETGLALARAGVDAAAFNAQRATIVAPDDGRIDRRLVEAGEVVAPGRPVFHLSGQSKGAVVRIGVSDRDVLRVREGDEAKVVVDARPGEAIPARVAQVATVASPGSGTFDVEVKLDPSSMTLLSGLTAKVEIAHVEEVPAAVPVSSLAFGVHDETGVFVVDDANRARRVKVKVAFLDGERAALATALEGHARVVTAGAGLVEDGTPVKVVP